MWMLCRAEARASRNIVYIEVPPPAGELRTTCVSWAGIGSAAGAGEHVGLDPGPTALGERGGDLVGLRAVFEDVLGVIDRPARLANHRELGREDLLAVQQDLHSVTADDGRPGVGAEGRRERRLLDVERRQLEMWRDSRTTHDQGEKQGETNPC